MVLLRKDYIQDNRDIFIRLNNHNDDYCDYQYSFNTFYIIIFCNFLQKVEMLMKKFINNQENMNKISSYVGFAIKSRNVLIGQSKIKQNRDFFEMAIDYVLLDNPAEKRENIVFVGDTYNTDVKGANGAGIDVIWINHKDEGNIDNLSVHSISNAGKLVGMIKKLI